MTEAPATLIVGAAPHWRSAGTTARANYLTLLALLPTALVGAAGHAFGARAGELGNSPGTMSNIIKVLVVELGVDAGVLWFFGILGTVALAMGVAVFTEYATQVAMRQPYRVVDGHAAIIGLLMALMMPPAVPFWVVIIGVAVAIFVGKQLYGGVGSYPMHPAAVGWLVLLLSWPHYLYPVGAASIATPTAAALTTTVLGGLFLWAAGVIRPQIVLGTLVGVLLFALLLQGRLQGSVGEQLVTGHVLLGAFFLATDTTTSPANRIPMWLFGLGFGGLIVLIRAFGIWPDAVPFAVLLMNILSPLLDRLAPKPREVVAL